MKSHFIKLVLLLLIVESQAQPTSVNNIDQKADSVLKRMTLDEKIGQLNQLSYDFNTGTPQKELKNIEEEISKGRIGSFLNTYSVDNKLRLQKIAMSKSRMKIPLLFGYDVIHGYQTVFPIPLAQSCSWDLAAIENAERIAAMEASSDGIHWAFAPMVDVSRDPRWGRVMEGAGEDTWLGSQIAKARIKGFQGNDLSKENTVLACVKHYAAYGAVEAGREYNAVEMSERQLREFYLPPFKAAAEAGAATFMNSFNSLAAVPASADKHLVKDILRDEWQFKGFVVSDWASIGELVYHGVAKDREDAARLAMANQSSDMDMASQVYIDYLKKLVEEGKVNESNINDACRKILRMKFALGLFDDPYRYFNKKRKEEMLGKKEHLEVSRDLARKSMVLLKNEGGLLPLKKDIKTIALIGPFANGKYKADYLSSWAPMGKQENVVTLLDGIKAKLGPSTTLLLATVCGFMGECGQGNIKQAAELAKQADIVILAIGENGDRNGECRSRSNIDLPGNQKELVQAVLATGKPTVAVLFNGRPLTLEWESKNIPAILEAWQPGNQAGNAVADVLFGDYNPAGKLTQSFPLNVGQIPVYYNHLNTGRPLLKAGEMWKSSYADIPNEPLYPFGYGLSYSSFSYSEVTLDKAEIAAGDTLQARVTINNTGKYAGEETVQLYIQDLVAEVSRPVKELRGFQKISLKSGESKSVTFFITVNDLKYWNAALKYKADAGEFKVMIGTNSADVKEKLFVLK